MQPMTQSILDPDQSPENFKRQQAKEWTVTKVIASKRWAFWGGIGHTLTIVRTMRVATAATDGLSIFWNILFWAKLSPEERIGLYLHEIGHVALMHPFRRGDRDPYLWNVACDYVINLLLREFGIFLPEGALLDEKYRGLQAEVIYERLKEEGREPPPPPPPGDEPPEEGDGPGRGGDQPTDKPGKEKIEGKGNGEGKPQLDDGGHTGWGDVIDPQTEDGKGLDPDKIKELEGEVRKVIQQAYNTMKRYGLEPGGPTEIIDGLVSPEVPWEEVLNRTVDAGLEPDGMNWQRPHRNFSDEDVFFPSVKMTGTGLLVCAIDTSGSCSTAELEAYVSNIEDLIMRIQPNHIMVLQFTSRITDVQDLVAGQQISRKMIERGGTDFRPIFNWVEELGEDPEHLIVFTDLCGPFPDDEPDYPVIWVATDDGEAPFGTTIKLNNI